MNACGRKGRKDCVFGRVRWKSKREKWKKRWNDYNRLADDVEICNKANDLSIRKVKHQEILVGWEEL